MLILKFFTNQWGWSEGFWSKQESQFSKLYAFSLNESCLKNNKSFEKPKILNKKKTKKTIYC